MNEYKHSRKAIEASIRHQDNCSGYSPEMSFLLGVEWASDSANCECYSPPPCLCRIMAAQRPAPRSVEVKTWKGTLGKWEKWTSHQGGNSSPIDSIEVGSYSYKTNGRRRGYIVHEVIASSDRLEEQLANAELIADAGNTIQKHNMLPSELLSRHDEAIRLLRLCTTVLAQHYQTETIDGPVPHSVVLAWSYSFLEKQIFKTNYPKNNI